MNMLSSDQIAMLSQIEPQTQGNLTHLGQNLSKLQKTKRFLEKNIDSMTLQMNETNKQIVNLKIENGKLKQKLEKATNKLTSQGGVLQKISEEIKTKEETMKKQATYITKLENQLVKGTLSLELIENNKKLEDKLDKLEREMRESQALNQALKAKLAHQEEKNNLLSSCLQINLNEFFGQTHKKISVEEMTQLCDFRSKEAQLETLRKEIENLRTLTENQQIELNSFQEALQRSFQENQSLKKALEEQINSRNSSETSEKTLRENLESQIIRLKEELANFSGKHNKLLEEKVCLEDEVRQQSEKIKEYRDLVGTCEELFQGDFESVLRESIGIINEKKVVKQRIHDIVRDCTEKLLEESCE